MRVTSKISICIIIHLSVFVESNGNPGTHDILKLSLYVANSDLPEIVLKDGEIPAIVAFNRKWTTKSHIGKVELDIPQVMFLKRQKKSKVWISFSVSFLNQVSSSAKLQSTFCSGLRLQFTKPHKCLR